MYKNGKYYYTSIQVNNERLVRSLRTTDKKVAKTRERQAKIDLYKDYIANFNRCSAELDTVDKENATSNHSTYRSVKNDETFVHVIKK